MNLVQKITGYHKAVGSVPVWGSEIVIGRFYTRDICISTNLSKHFVLSLVIVLLYKDGTSRIMRPHALSL